MSVLARLFGIVLGLAALAAGPAAHATTCTTLHSFTGPDGAHPVARLVFDATGAAVYGTTENGGSSNSGTVFKLDLATKTLTTLHAFTGPDGANPVAGLVFNAAGALYGTTANGGAPGMGTVFKLNPATKMLKTLHAFTGADGANPVAGLVFDAIGAALYGTTESGGSSNSGTVFKLDLATKTLTTLHAFTLGIEGASPRAGLIFNANGKLYGTTYYGGSSSSNLGTVFKLNPVTKVLTTLHSFTGGADGEFPLAELVFDTTGAALYGTTSSGSFSNFGTVFKLDLATKTLTTLHSFSGPDGANPVAGLVFDTAGALYGTTSNGTYVPFTADTVNPTVNPFPLAATIFRLDPATLGLTTLKYFLGPHGSVGPDAGLVFDTQGELYGTTSQGGGAGTVFKLVP
jgi:uncharacterized repeat protein (TIGR03803 family)